MGIVIMDLCQSGVRAWHWRSLSSCFVVLWQSFRLFPGYIIPVRFTESQTVAFVFNLTTGNITKTNFTFCDFTFQHRLGSSLTEQRENTTTLMISFEGLCLYCTPVCEGVSLAEKRLWMALVALREGSSRHWARQFRAWPWTVGDSSIRRAKSRFWIRELCIRKQTRSGSRHSSGLLSGCSSKTITTSTENSRCTICRGHRSQYLWQKVMKLTDI